MEAGGIFFWGAIRHIIPYSPFLYFFLPIPHLPGPLATSLVVLLLAVLIIIHIASLVAYRLGT